MIRFGQLYEADMIHPLEYEVMQSCQKNALYDWLAKEGAGLKMRMDDMAEALTRAYPVSRYTAPRLHRLYRLALSRLGCREEYPLFLTLGYDLKAVTTGSDADGHVILMNSSCLEELSDDELLALLGHELGHIKANHIQNTQLLSILETGAQNIPLVGTLAGKQLWTYFAQWLIASEFTADRAALFACESRSAVESLLLKQSGQTGPAPETLLAQTCDRPRKLGMYFVWLAQSMPVFGGIERIRELRRWTASPQFRGTYPAFFYCLLLESGQQPEDGTQAQLLSLHQKALDGDPAALCRLGEGYLTGTGGLSVSGKTALSLFSQAACRGSSKAMYVLAKCIDRKFEGLKADPARSERLVQASASRGYAPAIANAAARSGQAAPPALSNILEKFALNYPGAESCQLNDAHPGAAIPDSEQDLAGLRDGFWMDWGEAVYAVQTVVELDGAVYGLALGERGLYGRLVPEEFPFYVSWRCFLNDPLEQRELEDESYLCSGRTPLIRREGQLGGTILEILLRLHTA